MSQAKKKQSRRTGRRTGRLTQSELRAIRESEIRVAYDRGVIDGAKAERERLAEDLARESLKVRLELGRSFAAVFEGITRSASMFFDTGASVLK